MTLNTRRAEILRYFLNTDFKAYLIDDVGIFEKYLAELPESIYHKDLNMTFHSWELEYFPELTEIVGDVS